MADVECKVIVEVPKGSRNKYEYDEEDGVIELDRRLFSAVSFPTDYGFIPGTIGPQGDPLDALVCVTEPTFPGCRIKVKPIALHKQRDDEGPDPKVLCVPLNDPAWNHIEEVDDLPGQLKEEIDHFFTIYTDLEGQTVEIDGWGSRDAANEEIARAQERYGEQNG